VCLADLVGCGCFVACRSISSVSRTTWWPSWLSLVVRSGGSRHQDLHWRMRRWASWWLLSMWLYRACLATRNWTRECADGPAGGWHCSSRRVADRRWPMARGERAGGWWPVGGLARTKLAALRATRLLPCVVALGLASNTPRRRPLNYFFGALRQIFLHFFENRPRGSRAAQSRPQPIYKPPWPLFSRNKSHM